MFTGPTHFLPVWPKNWHRLILEKFKLSVLQHFTPTQAFNQTIYPLK